MNQVSALLKTLSASNIRLQVTEKGELAVRGDKQKLTADLVTRIKALKPDIIAWLHAAAEGDTNAQTLIPTLARDAESYPLSFAQQRLWFIQSVTGPSAQYNMFSAFDMRGNIDLNLMQQALHTVVQRHEVLRSIYVNAQGEGRQKILAEDAPAMNDLLQRVAVPTLAEEALNAWLHTQVQARSQQPFDLSTDLPIRCYAFDCPADTTEQRVILLFVMHHIASDEWSLSVAANELMQCYQQALQGAAATPLAALATQYVDYASWQKNYLDTDGGKHAAEYFAQQLQGAPEVHNLPMDYARPVTQDFAGKVHSVALPEPLSQSLRQLAAQQQVTLFVLLEAAFSVVIARASAEQRVVIGTPVAGRSQPALQPLIGFFVNTLPLHHQLDAEQPFSTYLQQVKQQVNQTLAHQDYPFDLLVEQLRPERSMSYSPLVQLVFTVADNQAQGLQLPDIQLQEFPIENQSAKFDLSVSCFDGKQSIEVHWNYATALFSAERVAQLQQQFEALLHSITRNVMCKVGDLALMSDAVRQATLSRASNHVAPMAMAQTQVVARFDAMAAQYPEKIAVRDSVLLRNLTFAELQHASEQLAMNLVQRGVKPADRVALYIDRSVDMVVAMLAILRAGAAYVPLDIHNPISRSQYIIDDSQPSVLVTRSDLAEELAELSLDTLGALDVSGAPDALSTLTDCTVLQMDQCDAQCRVTLPDVTPDSAAYLIYTSGSTGQPKGVVVQQRNIMALVKATNFYQPEAGDVIGQVANHAFDATTFEVWSALLHGNTTCIISREQLLDLDEFKAVLRRENISAMFLSAGIFNQVVQRHPDTFATMKTLLVGGDVVDASAVNQVILQGKPTHLLNGYGPTETTTFSSYYEILTEQSEPPIGTALAGHQHFVLDARQQLVPDGVVGELYIAGDGVSAGYWQRDALTTEKFVQLPLGENNALLRCYRTGDLVRYNNAGQLVFVGRVDKQIKLRGFRIELGEIAHRLQAVSTVKDALVSVAGEGERKYLVAYLIPAQDHALSQVDSDALIAQVREQLAVDLPDYMQPSGYLCMTAFPLNANGKVDMHALPAVPLVADEIRAASTDTEQFLHRAWAQLLGASADSFGITQNFFALGGHSLLATKLQSQVTDALQVRLPIRAFFEHPTIQQLAAFIDTKITTANAVTPVSIPKRAQSGGAPLSFAQQRLWFIDNLQGSSVEYHLPVAMRILGDLQLDALQQALNQLVARHSMLRTVYQQCGNEAEQITHAAGEVTMTVVNLRGEANQDATLQQQLAEEIARPFDLSSDLMLRVCLWQLGDAHAVLLFNQHHIASDGWSFDVLTRDFSVYYAQALGEYTAQTLPELAIDYTDYAAWQREQLTAYHQGDHADNALAQQLDYWKTQLANLPQVHNLPLDFARPAVQSFAGKTQQYLLDVALTTQLKQLAVEQGVSLFMLLQSAFALFISRWSGEQDIAIGTPVAGREQSQLQDLVGFFVNNLVLRSDVNTTQTFTEFLSQQKATILNAFSHQEVPFDLLVEVLQPERSLSHSPLYQVVFALQAQAQHELALPHVDIEGVLISDETSKFDLNLTMLDRAEQGLLCGWQYATSLFSEASIAHMAASFEQLLRNIVAAPARQLRQLSVVTDAQQQWLAQGHGPAFLPTTMPLIHQRVAAQVAKTPTAIAAVFGTQHITYLELEQRANQLAHCLRAQGVGCRAGDHLVGLFVQRSVDMLVGMLGILKAGGAYVPLDTNYPEARLHYMLNDVQAHVVVTQTDLVASLPDTISATVLSLDDPATLANFPTSAVNDADALTDNSLAYVIYTSGSTGNPKGVMVSHRNVMRLIENNNYVAFQASDVVAQASNHSFDAATFEIWGALTHGACLAYIDKETFLDPLLLKHALRDQSVSILFITTALVNQMAYVAADGFSCLRYLLFGGEAVDVNAVARLIEHGKPTHLLHVYGPTESTTYSTFYEITQRRDDTYPIGKSISGTTHYVLDENAQRVPPGVVGELYLGGDGVARGYLGREEQTQRVFIPNAFQGEQDPSARLYKTGDLVRVDAEGDLIYVARVDHQVKLRGFRIELGEIENALRQVPVVEEALVAVIGEGVKRRLVAWFTNENADDADAVEQAIADCRAALVGELPDYMQPTAYAVLTEFPLTPNGKIDRKILPDPQVTTEEAAFVEADTALETAVSAVWQRLFDREQVSVVANFFTLGGHSILATRLVAELNQQLSVTLTVRDIFELQTIRAQAHKIQQLQDSGVTATDSDIHQRFTDNADVEEFEL